jgi:hypothetical protein
MPMYVPTLDHTVFQAPAPRNYGDLVVRPKDYMAEFNKQRDAEMQRQIALQKYQQDLLKSQQYLEMYPDYRDAQTAELRARTARANAMVPYYAARTTDLATRNSPHTDDAYMTRLKANRERQPGGTTDTDGVSMGKVGGGGTTSDEAPAPVGPWDQSGNFLGPNFVPATDAQLYGSGQ